MSTALVANDSGGGKHGKHHPDQGGAFPPPLSLATIAVSVGAMC